MNSEIPAAAIDERQNVDVQSDRPRPKQRHRGEPLDDRDKETLAQFLAAPDDLREFESITSLASHLKISRATIYRWTKDPAVLRRAEHLSLQNKLAGDLFARREWLPIMRKVVERAKSGDIQAAKFCAACAWPESTGVGQGLTIEEALRMTENEGESPSFAVEYCAPQGGPPQELDARSEDKSPAELTS